MTNHPNRSQIISSMARNAYPGDQVRVMRRVHIDMQGRAWPAETEYTPLSRGVDNTTRGASTVQLVSIGGVRVEFAGGRNSH